MGVALTKAKAFNAAYFPDQPAGTRKCDVAAELEARCYKHSSLKKVAEDEERRAQLQPLVEWAEDLLERRRAGAPSLRVLAAWQQRLQAEASELQAALEAVLGCTPQMLEGGVLAALPMGCYCAYLGGCCPWFDYNYLNAASKAGRTALGNLAACDFPTDDCGTHAIVAGNQRWECCRTGTNSCLVTFQSDELEQACEEVQFICMCLIEVYRNLRFVYLLAAGELEGERMFGTKQISDIPLPTIGLFAKIAQTGSITHHLSSAQYAYLNLDKALKVLLHTQVHLRFAQFAVERANEFDWPESATVQLELLEAAADDIHTLAAAKMIEVFGVDAEELKTFRVTWVTNLLDEAGTPLTALPPDVCTQCRRAALVYTRQSGRSEVGLCPGPFGPKTICKTCYVHWKKLNQVEKEEVQAEAAKQGLAKNNGIAGNQPTDGWRKGDPWVFLTVADDGTVFGTRKKKFCTFCGVTNPKQFSMGPMGQSTLCGKHGKRWVKLTQKQKDDIQSQAQAARLQHLGRQAGRQAASSV